MVAWKEAASLILLRAVRSSPRFDYEVLLLHRTPKQRSFPSFHVFPGGTLDTADGKPVNEAERLSNIIGPNFPHLTYKRCALRETFEETGLFPVPLSLKNSQKFNDARNSLLSGTHCLDDSLKELYKGKSSLVDHFFKEEVLFWRCWLTPEIEKRRYNTMFYLTCIDTPDLIHLSNSISVNVGENTSLEWRSIDRVLENYYAKTLPLMPPQIFELCAMSRFSTLAELKAYAKTINAAKHHRIFPILGTDDETGHVISAIYPGDLEYPYANNEERTLALGSLQNDETKPMLRMRHIRPKFLDCDFVSNPQDKRMCDNHLMPFGTKEIASLFDIKPTPLDSKL